MTLKKRKLLILPKMSHYYPYETITGYTYERGFVNWCMSSSPLLALRKLKTIISCGLLVVGIILAIVLSSVLVMLPPLPPVPNQQYAFAIGSVGAGKIAFVSNRDGNDEIYVMNADGSGQTRLTNNPASDRSPDWSPDGTRIAFQSNKDGNDEIYAINVEGKIKLQTRLTSNSGHDHHPVWSPDGKKIAWHRFGSQGQPHLQIWVMSPVTLGAGVKKLADSPSDDRDPSWSPNGKKIVFTRASSEDNMQIYVINTDGTGLKKLSSTPLPVRDDNPDWTVGVPSSPLPFGSTSPDVQAHLSGNPRIK